MSCYYFSIFRKIRTTKIVSLLKAHRSQNRHVSSNISDIGKLLDEIPDLTFYALRLGSTGCSVGRPNYNSFTSGYIDIDRVVGKTPDSLLCTSMKRIYSETFSNIQNSYDVKNYDDVIGVLNEYLETKGFHYECFVKGMELAYDKRNDTKTGETEISETTVALLFALHLLSRLTIGKGPTYAVSVDYKEKPIYCPCGICDSKVVYASTEIGSEDLFYGRPNIVLFPNYNNKEQVVNIVYPAEATFSKVEMEKRQKEGTDFVEMERDLKNEASFEQVALETLTFSFYHRVHQENKHGLDNYVMKSSLVPTISICDEGFNVCWYDSVNDIFLKNYGRPVPLFDASGTSFRTASVINLWLLINHSLFQPRLSEKARNNMKGSFGLLSADFVSDAKYERIKDTMSLDINLKNKNFDRFKDWEERSIQLSMEDYKRGAFY